MYFTDGLVDDLAEKILCSFPFVYPSTVRGKLSPSDKEAWIDKSVVNQAQEKTQTIR